MCGIQIYEHVYHQKPFVLPIQINYVRTNWLLCLRQNAWAIEAWKRHKLVKMSVFDVCMEVQICHIGIISYLPWTINLTAFYFRFGHAQKFIEATHWFYIWTRDQLFVFDLQIPITHLASNFPIIIKKHFMCKRWQRTTFLDIFYTFFWSKTATDILRR